MQPSSVVVLVRVLLATLRAKDWRVGAATAFLLVAFLFMERILTYNQTEQNMKSTHAKELLAKLCEESNKGNVTSQACAMALVQDHFRDNPEARKLLEALIQDETKMKSVIKISQNIDKIEASLGNKVKVEQLESGPITDNMPYDSAQTPPMN